MQNSKKTHRNPPSSKYTHEYYLTNCHGYDEFNKSQGKLIPLRLIKSLSIADIQPGMRILDIGCGRGEILLNCAKLNTKAFGIDYSIAAIRIARNLMIDSAPKNLQEKIHVQISDSCCLPYKSESMNRIFMLDFVEHIIPVELKKAFDESWRVLKPGGKLIIHTMPSLWYYKYGYPLYRILEKMRGNNIPKNPRDRQKYGYFHINEQDPVMLRKALEGSKFNTRVWLDTIQTYGYEENPFLRSTMRVLTHIQPFKLAFCNDIFAVGIK